MSRAIRILYLTYCKKILGSNLRGYKKNVLKTKKITSRSNQNNNNHITKQRYKQKWSSNVISQ